MRWIVGLVLLAGCATAPSGYWTVAPDGGFCYQTAKGCSAKGPANSWDLSADAWKAIDRFVKDMPPAYSGGLK